MTLENAFAIIAVRVIRKMCSVESMTILCFLLQQQVDRDDVTLSVGKLLVAALLCRQAHPFLLSSIHLPRHVSRLPVMKESHAHRGRRDERTSL